MPIWLHLTLLITTQAAGAFSFPHLAVQAAICMKIEPGGPLFLVMVFGAFFAGFLVPGLVFKYLIFARCKRCGGRAVFCRGQPISYRCESCGHVHWTNTGGWR